jgi:hypothetical protein
VFDLLSCREVLAKGPQLSTDVIARAEAKGFTQSQLRAAKTRLGISRESGTVHFKSGRA